MVLTSSFPLHDAAAAEDDRNAVIDLSFPAAGPVQWEDDYDEPRDGGARVHQGTDLYGEKLQRVHAAVGGVVCNQTTAEAAVGGYQVVICGDDGRRYAYTHLNDDRPGTDDGRGGLRWAYAPGVREGVRVVRGRWLGYMGDSGNAEDDGAQLHFHVTDPALHDPALVQPPYVQGRRNPYPSFVAAQVRGDVPAEPVARERLAGATRTATAAALAAARGQGPVVVLAPAGAYAGALVAAPLAHALDAPVLLAGADGLDAVTRGAVTARGASQALLVGPRGELPATLEAELAALGVLATERLEGDGPAGVAAAVARYLAALLDVGEVIVALGEAGCPGCPDPWADAVGGSALAAQRRAPVLLVGRDALPEAVGAVLAELAPVTVTVLGGPAAVSDAVLAEIGARAGTAPGRIAGATRWDTSAAVANTSLAAGLDGPAVWVATGTAFPDALAAGPAAAAAGSPLLLVDGTRDHWDDPAPPEPLAFLLGRAGAAATLVAVGGEAAVSERASVLAAGILAG